MLMRNKNLSDEIYQKIEGLCEKGNELIEKEQYNLAIQKFIEALNLVPSPKKNWEASTWILTAIGDSNFLSGNFQSSLEYLQQALQCPNGLGNPFIHLRLG